MDRDIITQRTHLIMFIFLHVKVTEVEKTIDQSLKHNIMSE